MEAAILILTSWVISDRILILYNKQMNSEWLAYVEPRVLST